ncbi:D-2-hydroxyacid dehydrogenase [Pseudalkalibacillus caeni]|uniref:D-2-hydroxyacid dehydrogenase n=1 Tax=Exobacillus caeni TaxID=2574798 RepID=A0A5R9F2Q5_9BACL|nr:D-2-hydroxyacid dehydrogenase [Pseudalkalibacillus caeni]TLS36780.1 D-2-hydroxyacid dehydrogenase [Pseudalkalibacillus caeni]
MNIHKILVVSPMHKEIQTVLEEKGLGKAFRYLPEEETGSADLEWADAFLAFNTKNDYDYSKVKWVHSLGAGVDRFLFQKDWDEDVLLTRTICSFGQRIGEYCLSYILKDIQYHNEFQSFQAAQKWQPMTPAMLREQKVLIYGTGEIGQKAAEILSSFDVKVYGVSLSGRQKDFFEEVFPVENHFSRLNEMDYLINTLPLTKKTEGLFDASIFEKLDAAGFINVGRGASLKESALLDALKNNHLRFAVLDVFSEEPLSKDSPLWEHPRISLTPHISAVTTAEEAVDCFVETLKNVEQEKPLKNKVDISKGF